jgi:hypothetical protein
LVSCLRGELLLRRYQVLNCIFHHWTVDLPWRDYGKRREYILSTNDT